ncbi:hypothetical protein [Rickettsiella massiliensis]|uniref:hypothetical protein n=1 Tax=Rickettsiella massiliensis TaxID=676517 RepID=UPI00029B225C|nr:hypothetical protein [Rickettsiella massiliensis]
MFGLLLTFFSCNPDVAQNSAFIYIELMIPLFLTFLGIPYLMKGVETTIVMTDSLFQKTNQVPKQAVYSSAGKVRHATSGCFFNTVDESGNDEVFSWGYDIEPSF